MRSKRVVCFVWVLVFIVLVCAGCLEKEAKWHQKTIKKLESRMEVTTGPGFKATVENLGKKKRSLALYIAEDHAKLAALFMTKQFAQMEVEMGTDVKLDGNAMGSPGAIHEYWEKKWNEKYEMLSDEKQQNIDSKYTIELQIWSKKIEMSQYTSVKIKTRSVHGAQVEYRYDGESVELFEFDVVLKKVKNGKIVSNQSGTGEWPRGHSEECPWI